MFKFNRGTEEDWPYYSVSKKLSDNSKVTLILHEVFSNYDITYFSVYLSIKRKRKHEVFLKQTGKCGLEGLLWGKDKLVDFEEFIQNESWHHKIKLVVAWDDNRRRNVYNRTLLKLGYRIEMLEGKKCLVKTLVANKL